MRVCQRLNRVIVTPGHSVYDAGLSAAAETLVEILKIVTVTFAVYPCFREFLDVDIQSTGHTLSRPWSRQPNDVMSEIECAQLHSELFRRRHSTRQSHGLFALVKHLLSFTKTNSAVGENPSSDPLQHEWIISERCNEIIKHCSD